MIHVRCAATLAAVVASGCAASYLRRAPASPREPWQFPADPGWVGDGVTAVAADREYDLPALIDLAESINPDTRIGWERARQAALGVGVATAAYFPIISGFTIAGYQHTFFPVPDLSGATLGINPFQVLPSVNFAAPELPQTSGRIGVTTWQVLPFLNLRWEVLNLSRGSDVRAAENLSTAANALFTAEHERVIFEVARAFYRLNAARAQLAVSRDALARTRVIAGAADARYAQGLATAVDTAEARREVSQAEYNVVQAQAIEIAANAALVSALGIDPQVPVRVAEHPSGTLPARLAKPVTAYIDAALAQRADLHAARARLPATDAVVSRNLGTYVPRVSLVAIGGAAWLGARIDGISLPTLSLPNYGAYLNVEWLLFDGGLREIQTEVARSQHAEAVQQLAKMRHQVVQEVVTAFNEATAALSRYAAAGTLLDSATTAEDATTTSYMNGLSTLSDAMTAEKVRSLASAAKEQAFADALVAMTTLAFASGELLSPRAVPR
jgi:outer membrane protein TolC